MGTSIRTELGVGRPGPCPVARASDGGPRISRVSRSSTMNRGGTVSEEFVVDDQDHVDTAAADEVFVDGTRRVYRFERGREAPCVCECIERHGCPVADISARDGTLVVAFYAPELATVRDVVGDLDEAFEAVHLRQMTRSDDGSNRDLVLVDRNRLTDRQREVLQTGFEAGYFDYPKRANATEVAAELGIAPSTFSEHLAAAQQKLLEMVLESGT